MRVARVARDMAEGLDYAGSGVDIDLEGNAVGALVGALSRSVRKPGTPGAPVDLPGGFGGLVEFGDNYLALATDGVGSKLSIATKLNQWAGVGIDCMAMNVNDLLCVGAEPIAFVDYIAVPKPDPEVHAALGASLAEACRRARVTLAGGETASLPGIVTELDLSGTALGWLAKGSEITGANLKNGDVLIGMPASGVHSNGYSLVRNVVSHCGASWEDSSPFQVDINRFIPPTDPWRGSAKIGGEILHSGLPANRNQPEYFSFDWLRDVRDFGGDAARIFVRDEISLWLSENINWDAKSWHPKILGDRLSEV